MCLKLSCIGVEVPGLYVPMLTSPWVKAVHGKGLSTNLSEMILFSCERDCKETAVSTPRSWEKDALVPKKASGWQSTALVSRAGAWGWMVVRHFGLSCVSTVSADGLSFAHPCTAHLGPRTHWCFFIIFGVQNSCQGSVHGPWCLDILLAFFFLYLYISWDVSRELLDLCCSPRDPLVFLSSQPWGGMGSVFFF